MPRAGGEASRAACCGRFALMEQMQDFAYYEAAVAGGRSVISVKATGEARIRSSVDVLLRNGAHFINHFGLFTTEEFALWRGDEPNLPGFMRR